MLQHNTLRPKQALNKAYLKLKTARTEIEKFKLALTALLDSINLHESEEHAKNHLRDFLRLTFYDKYGVNTKGKTDLVIHTGNSTRSNAGVLLEVKRPTNKADMPTTDNLNYKATHELLLYYLRERLEHNNHDLRHLIVTSVHEWFVFDALEFDRLFFRNAQLRKDFTDWSAGRKASGSTDFFYKEIAAPYLEKLTESISYTYFNLKDYEKPLRNQNLKDDVKLVALYKLLSPAHLLKEPFANDANSLDRDFYLELLHIIGLEEVKEGGRKLIRRKAKPNPGSLLEAAYQKLRSEDLISGLDNPYSFGHTREEQLFNVALELCITWMNRVLFLKLLEAQLISYHHGDKKYGFMSTANLREFDDLNELFFDVLAERPENRSASVRSKYSHIPYLNSSLFETTALEKRTLRISNLKDRSLLPLYPQTVFRRTLGKDFTGKYPELHTLEYLLRFLGSYDFGAESKEEIQEENKTLITASVLGLIFEKINGYRDGSFYTPGFITMYMSREAIRRAVVERFSERYGWVAGSNPNGITFEDLQLRIHQNYTLQSIQEYNELINSLRICDPAVGSGHYLVSALNELIVIKHDLRILTNRQGKPLHYGSIELQNDELIVTDHYGEPFSYTVTEHPDGRRSINPQVQELQEALFHEKQTIIENCLFGVDINPNSVKICRLRLWIELLKNAYYCQHQDLQDSRINSEGNSKKLADPDMSSSVCYANSSDLREGFDIENSWKSLNPVNPDSDKYTQLQTLPNIDINIKQGNSLLSRYPLTADLKEAFGKKGHSLQAYRDAVARYKHTNSKEDKKRLEAFLEEIKQGFKTSLANNDPLRKKMADLRGQISVMQNPDLFGAKKVDKKQLQQKQKQLQQLEAERDAIETNKVYEGAFEWRFEFPEVLDEEGRYRGFDVVIGNPPYIRQEELGDFKLYLKKHFDTFAGTADLYVYFVERGIDLLREGGQFSYIIPNKWMRAGYGQPLRSWLQRHTLQQLLDFGDLPVFEEATTYPLIASVTKAIPAEGYTFEAAGIGTLEFEQGLAHYVQQHGYEVQAQLLPDSGWNLSDSISQQLLEKLKNTGIPLGEYVEGKMFRGVLTGYNEAFVIDEATKDRLIAEDPRSGEVIKPFLLGRDLKRYRTPIINQYLLFIPWHFPLHKDLSITGASLEAESAFESGYPAIYNHLLKYKIGLSNRNKAETGIRYEWYALQRCAATYFEEFHKQKIMFQEIATFPAFVLDKSESYSNNKTYIIPDVGNYLLGILNSKITWWFLNQITSKLQGGALAMQSIYTTQIPIAQADEATKAGIRELVEQVLAAKQADAGADTSALEAEIDLQVYRLYQLTYEEVLLVDPAFAMPREEYEAAALLNVTNSTS